MSKEECLVVYGFGSVLGMGLGMGLARKSLFPRSKLLMGRLDECMHVYCVRTNVLTSTMFLKSRVKSTCVGYRER